MDISYMLTFYVNFILKFIFKSLLFLQGKHCLLSISPSAIERLHRLQIYPIVVFARHRSHKQLR